MAKQPAVKTRSAAPKAAVKQTAKRYAPSGVRFHTRRPLDAFISLKPGEEIEGVFTGTYPGQFGTVYKFRLDDGSHVGLNGRMGIDSQFEEAALDPETFPDGTLLGHRIVVVRDDDVPTKAGRTVGVYRVGHVIANCPKGCGNPSA